METKNSQALFQRACQVMPGGVNSPVRAFGAVGGCPRFISRADKTQIWDGDGNQYTDYIGSWGPLLLGHNQPEIRRAVTEAAAKGLSFGAATEAEVEMAELVCQLVPSVEMVRMVSSGTEAVMSAVRAARGFTGREKLIKFAGCYHGHSDAMLVKAGSGLMTAGEADSAGVTGGCVQDTLTAQYNDLTGVETLFAKNPGQIAALIIEPVAANMGVVLPDPGFLMALRRLCTEQGALLIFDEVITGFRLGLAGAQGRYRVCPDLTTFGKIIGAGMPVGAYGGRREIMAQIAPKGPIYQAGTLSGNPVAMAAGLCQLRQLRDQKKIYGQLEEMGERLFGGLAKLGSQSKLPCCVNHVGSLGCLFFTQGPVKNDSQARQADRGLYSRFFNHMLQRGIYLAPSQFEAIFLSAAHTQAQVDDFLAAAAQFLLGGEQ